MKKVERWRESKVDVEKCVDYGKKNDSIIMNVPKW